MQLPNPTELQFIILGYLVPGPMPGCDLRECLKQDHNRRKSLASFYKLMARMEDKGMVEGSYESFHIKGIPCRQRKYELSDVGLQVHIIAAPYFANLADLRPIPASGLING